MLLLEDAIFIIIPSVINMDVYLIIPEVESYLGSSRLRNQHWHREYIFDLGG